MTNICKPDNSNPRSSPTKLGVVFASGLSNRARLMLAALSVFLLLAVEGNSQVRFVQITDPHIFDDKRPEDKENNKESLSAAIKKINERIEQGAGYDFVVVTGDLGIEALITPADEAATTSNLKQMAAGMADILKHSKVRKWMFLAGNNDLYDERPDTIKYYNSFIEALGAALTDKAIIDLNRSGGAGLETINGFSFIGFNNASFRNQNDPNRLKCVADEDDTKDDHDHPIHAGQLREVQSVADRLKAHDVRVAYIFYHIPEIDDPHLLGLGPDHKEIQTKLKSKQCIGEENVYSPWFVNQTIRGAWAEVVKNEKVKGLFAGHFHASWRETYLNNRWMRSSAYLSGSLSKLYVCPPLAVKFQEDPKEQARGFQEISIDAKGNVLNADKTFGVHIFWYDQKTKTFSTDFDDEKERQAIENLKLGMLMENSGRMKEAEAAYTKALASRSAVTRQEASKALDAVVAKQSSLWNRYLFTRWPLSPEGALLLSALVILLLSLVVLSGDTISFDFHDHPLSATWTVLLLALASLFIWMVLWLSNKSLLKDWKPSFSPGIAILLAALALLLSVWVVQTVMVGRGRDRLTVVPLVDVTQHKLGGTFPQILSMTREDLLSVRNAGIFVPVRNAEIFVPVSPPIIVIGEDAETVGLVESSIGGVWGKVIGWFLRKSMRPEYTLRGTLQSAGAALTITASLERRGKVLQTWARTFAVDNLFAEERQLSQDILTYLENATV